MCIAIPMRIKEIKNDTEAVAVRPGRTELVNTTLLPEHVNEGDLVLVFRGNVLRTVGQEEALKIEQALACVDEAIQTESASGVDDAFADIIANTGRLPEHLQKLVGKKSA